MELNLGDPAPTSTNAPTMNDPWGAPSYQNDPWSAPIQAPPKNNGMCFIQLMKSKYFLVYPDLLGSPVHVNSPPNDPWAAASTTATKPASNDPWGFSEPTPMTTTANNDPWASAFDSNNQASNDPWAAPAPLNVQPLPSSTVSNGTRPSSKTPESFLGESSSLVNFDNLMGPSPSSLPPRSGSEFFSYL